MNNRDRQSYPPGTTPAQRTAARRARAKLNAVAPVEEDYNPDWQRQKQARPKPSMPVYQFLERARDEAQG